MLSNTQKEIYDLRKKVMENFDGIEEARVYNMTIELYSKLFQYKGETPISQRRIMAHQDYVFVRALQDKEKRVKTNNNRTNLINRLRNAGLL